MNVLILDKDPFILAMLQKALVKWGYVVYAYSNPSHCPAYCAKSCPCELAEQGCPEIILADMEISGSGGLQFIAELKHKGCKFRKIGLISDTWNAVDLQKASHLGASVFAKPFHIPSLYSWISAENKRVA